MGGTHELIQASGATAQSLAEPEQRHESGQLPHAIKTVALLLLTLGNADGFQVVGPVAGRFQIVGPGAAQTLRAPPSNRAAWPRATMFRRTTPHNLQMTAADDDSGSDEFRVPSSGNFVTPIGPFCPFRSKAVDSGPLNDEMVFLSQSFSPRFVVELSRIQLEMQAGSTPDKERVISLADELLVAADKWDTSLTRMRMATDFQARELFKITEAFAQRRAESIDSVGKMMRWQADSMRAFATDTMPPPPPPGLDLMAMSQEPENTQPMGMMSSAGAVDSLPFTGDEAPFKEASVKKEYENLSRDHANIIRMGEGYGGFDRLGKVAFIDAVEAIEERWDIFFARFSLMGALNPKFKEQISDYLETMGLSPAEYRKLVREAHDMMRSDAENERAQ